MTAETPKRNYRRVLIVHPDPAIRQCVEQALRRVAGGALAVFHVEGPAEAIEKARRVDPQVVLLGLDESMSLALDAARSLRKERRLIVGLYNPVVEFGADADRVRKAARAGVADFVTLPLSDADLEAALEATAPNEEQRRSAEARTIAFYSNKGGVGATTLAANVAVNLARQTPGDPAAVVLFDADMQFGCAADLLGLQADRDATDLAADLDQAGPLSAYLVRHADSGLFLLASPGDLVRAESISPDDASRMAIALRRHFRTVVIDLSSRMDALTLNLLDLSDTVCILTEPVMPTVQRTARLLALLLEQGFDGERLRVAVRRFATEDGTLADAAIREHLRHPVDWSIPYESRAVEALHHGVPLSLERPRSSFAETITGMCRNLLSPRRPQPET